MAKFINSKTSSMLVELPYGLFDAARASGVSITDTGVVCVDGENRALAWLEVGDLTTRRRIAKALTAQVMAARNGEVVDPIDWQELGYEV